MKKALILSLFLVIVLPTFTHAQPILGPEKIRPQLAPNQFWDTVRIITSDPKTKDFDFRTIVILLQKSEVSPEDSSYIFVSWVQDNKKLFKQKIDWHLFVVNSEIFFIHDCGERYRVIDAHDQDGIGDLNHLSFEYWDNVVYHLVTKYVGNLETVCVEKDLEKLEIQGSFKTAKLQFLGKAAGKGTYVEEITYLYRISKESR